MKKIHRYLFLLPAALLMTACSNETEMETALTPDTGATPVMAMATMPGGNADTRITFEPAADKSKLAVKWNASGESFQVVRGHDKNLWATFVQTAAPDANGKAAFKLKEGETLNEGTDNYYYAIYPAATKNSNEEYDSPVDFKMDISNQVGTSYDADADKTYMWARTTYTEGEPLNFTFAHLTAVMQVDIDVTNVGIPANTSISNITISGENLYYRRQYSITNASNMWGSSSYNAEGPITLSGANVTSKEGKNILTIYFRLFPTRTNYPLKNLTASFSYTDQTNTTINCVASIVTKEEGMQIEAGKWYYNNTPCVAWPTKLHIATAGELGTQKTDDETAAYARIAAAVSSTGTLEVTGVPSTEDFQAIRDWAVKQETDDATPKLVTLDLSGLDASVTAMPNNAFYCKNTPLSTLETVKLPASITAINQYAFYQCTGLTTVELSAETEIGSNAFDGCTSLATMDWSKVNKIGSYSFRNCGFTTIVAPTNSSVTEIGTHAFEDCTKLTKVVFNTDKLEVVQSFAFAQCAALTQICLSATNLEGNLFPNCKKLTDIELNATSFTEVDTNIFSSYIDLFARSATLKLAEGQTVKKTSNVGGYKWEPVTGTSIDINSFKSIIVGETTKK